MSRNAMVKGQVSEIGTRLTGVLASVEIAEGRHVKAGQELGRLDDRHLRAEAREAQAEIEGLELQVELERLAIAHERRLLDNRQRETMANHSAARAEVTAAQSRADDAHEFNKARALLSEANMVSREEARSAQARNKTAAAQLSTAVAKSQAAAALAQATHIENEGLTVREKRVEVLQSNVLRAQARLAKIQADTEASIIRAPQDGAVIRWFIKPGGSVDIGKPVVSMSLGKDAWIEAWIDEDEIHRVREGSRAMVTLPSHPDREFAGTVSVIGVATDFEMPTGEVPLPRALRMRGAPVVGVMVRLHDAPQSLLPGLSAVVAINN